MNYQKKISIGLVLFLIGIFTKYPGYHWINTIIAFAILFIIAKAFVAEKKGNQKD